MAKKDTDLITEFAEPEAPKPVKTLAQVTAESNTALRKAQDRKRALHKHYREEPTIPLYLSPTYRPYFGKVMTVSINGISIYFKVDGTIQHVPKTFADEITGRRMRIDAIMTQQSRMADISNNKDSHIGATRLY